MPPHKHSFKEDHNFSEFTIADLKQQTESNTYHLSTVSKEISDIKDFQKKALKDSFDTQLILNKCSNDIVWLKKIFWGLLVFSGGTFATTLSKLILGVLQK